MDDNTIIDLFHARSEQAIPALAEKYGAVCSRVARNILNDTRDAEECINDTWLGAWNAMPPQRPDPLRTYLCRIVRNLATTRYHANTAKKRCSAYDAALDELAECLASPASVEADCAARELTRLLDRFLDGLDLESRVLFVRRYWFSDSIPVLAEQFRISRNNVSVRLSRLRTQLRQYLKREGYLL